MFGVCLRTACTTLLKPFGAYVFGIKRLTCASNATSKILYAPAYTEFMTEIWIIECFFSAASSANDTPKCSQPETLVCLQIWPALIIIIRSFVRLLGPTTRSASMSWAKLTDPEQKTNIRKIGINVKIFSGYCAGRDFFGFRSRSPPHRPPKNKYRNSAMRTTWKTMEFLKVINSCCRNSELIRQ